MSLLRRVLVPRPTSAARGFSLIELLVVLFVLSLFSSLVVISIGDNFSRQLRSEAERFQQLLAAAADESLYSASDWGFLLAEGGYIPLRFNALERYWQPLEAPVWQAYSLDETMAIRWSIEGFSSREEGHIDSDSAVYNNNYYEDREIGGAGEGVSRQAAFIEDELFELLRNGSVEELQRLELRPHIFLPSSGELSAFRVEFIAADTGLSAARYVVHSDGFAMPQLRDLSSH